MTADTGHPPRRIRSFVRREGRDSARRQQTFEQLWPRYGIAPDSGMLDLQQLFGNDAPCLLEIGFGTGTALLHMASSNPHNNYLGVEVYETGISKLMKLADQAGLDNLRLFNGDAVEVLKQQIPDEALAGIYVFFPDPWQKKRHHKRRLIQADFMRLALAKLKSGGVFHAATDWEDYALHMMEVLSAINGLENQAGPGQYAQRPDYRPVTKFEQRGQRLGHAVWDLLFRKK